MFILGNLIEAAALILSSVLQIYYYVVLITVLLSWVSPDPFNPIVRVLRGLTEPVFDWVRRYLPFTSAGMMDFSPLVVFFGVWFLRIFLVRSLLDVAARLR